MSLIKGKVYMYIGYSSHRYTKGKLYPCVVDGYLETNTGEHHRPFFTGDFEEFAAESVSRDIPKKHKNTYEFKVSSEDAIDHSEIFRTLTREHPVAIVKRSDGLHMVLVHDSLHDKSYYVDESLRDEFMEAMEPYWNGYQPYSSGALKKLMEVLKRLKAAPYKNKGSLVCQVELLSI